MPTEGKVGIISLIECMVCRWVFQISVRICWNPAWQAGCAGMHVINNTQKTEAGKKSLYLIPLHTHTVPAVLDKRLSAL